MLNPETTDPEVFAENQTYGARMREWRNGTLLTMRAADHADEHNRPRLIEEVRFAARYCARYAFKLLKMEAQS